VEELNYLLGYENLKIYQHTDKFKFSLDAILLANFVTINKNINRILDIGSGTGVIPLVLSTKTFKHIDGIEIQKDIYDLSVKSIEYNELNEQISFINEDINDWYKNIETDTYDVIICNPPYFNTKKEELLNDSNNKKISRHELTLTIEQIMIVSRKLLKNNGVFAMVYRPDRLIDVFLLMRKYNIEPKKIQYIYPKKTRACNLILIEGTKNGNPGLKILEPLIIHKKNNEYTQQVNKYFK